MPRVCPVPEDGDTEHVHEPTGFLFAIDSSLMPRANPLRRYKEACPAALNAMKAVGGEMTQEGVAPD